MDPQKSHASAVRRGRVLIVDDEAIIRGMLKIQLAERYEVFTASSGAEALEILRREKVDLIVSDINMPGMKGYELLERVHAQYPQTRTALITAYDTDDYIGVAKRHGITSIIPKSTPFNFDEFDVVVDGLVTGEVFGLERYLLPQHTIEAEYVVRCSDDILRTEDDIMQRLAVFHRPEPFVQILLEELITNAVYHAPVDKNGCQKYAKHAPVVLEESESVQVTLGRDSEKFGVSVSDHSGRLTRQQILYCLDRHVSAEGVLDESGRGLHMSRIYADRLIVNIRPHVITEVIFIVYFEKKYVGFKPLYINEV